MYVCTCASVCTYVFVYMPFLLALSQNVCMYACMHSAFGHVYSVCIYKHTQNADAPRDRLTAGEAVCSRVFCAGVPGAGEFRDAPPNPNKEPKVWFTASVTEGMAGDGAAAGVRCG